ncbi:MAG: LytR C-terminal domain-containing protein [Candidatus Levybacteria bacterium]|nr:LytR C-terminal domain-containing protein [Candidatus Levybacteria bacterium]
MKHSVPGSKKSQSMRIVGLFCLAVGILVCVSLFFKFATVIAKSTFDGQHRFTILQRGNPVRFYSFAPDSNTISVLDVVTESKTPEKLIAIPVDTAINDMEYHPDSTEVEEYLRHVFFSINGLQTNMTALDVFRLWLFSRSVHANDIIVEKIEDISKFGRLNAKLFSDETIIQEDKSIQIINATGVVGVGNDFSEQLSTIGGNVISVTTARKIVPKTIIQYYGESSYTLQKIEKMLHKKATSLQKQGISDIIIILGKDSVQP